MLVGGVEGMDAQKKEEKKKRRWESVWKRASEGDESESARMSAGHLHEGNEAPDAPLLRTDSAGRGAVCLLVCRWTPRTNLRVMKPTELFLL